MAMKTPRAGRSTIAPVFVPRSRTPSTPGGSSDPVTSASSWSQTTSTLGFLNSRSWRIFSARRAVAAVHERHLRGEVRQEQRLLDGGVAAAHHHDLLAAVEEPVAGRAGRDAVSLEALLGRQPQPLGLGARGQDQRVGEVFGAAVGDGAERPAREVERGHDVRDDLGAGLARVRLHAGHEVGAHDGGVAGPVLDVGGDGELAAGLEPLDQHRVEHRARGVDGRRVARRARADDQDLDAAGLGRGVGHGRGSSVGLPR